MLIKLRSPISAVWSVEDCTDPTNQVLSNFTTSAQVDGVRAIGGRSFQFARNTILEIRECMDSEREGSPSSMDSISKTF